MITSPLTRQVMQTIIDSDVGDNADTVAPPAPHPRPRGRPRQDPFRTPTPEEARLLQKVHENIGHPRRSDFVSAEIRECQITFDQAGK